LPFTINLPRRWEAFHSTFKKHDKIDKHGFDRQFLRI
jgi:hypothetical protein